MPEEIETIGNNAFKGCISLKSIEIPESVGFIGSSAFEGCSSLTNIKIPGNVYAIASTAFSGCNNLQRIDVDTNNKKYLSDDGILFDKEKTKILKYPEGKKDTKEYKIPDGIMTISYFAFSGCSNLTSIVIPESVMTIETGSFSGCSSLRNIEIPKRVTEIGWSTFDGCSSLTDIKIPEGVTKIGGSAFEGCSSLTNINIPEGVTEIGGSSAFEGCSSLTNIEIPEGVTEIGWYTFYGCSSLTDIEIPESVTEIGLNAFQGCSSLTNIKIPEGVTEIGRYAFQGCSSLTNIEISESVTTIGRGTFQGCSSLTNVNIPEGVTKIEYRTFAECSSLTNINILEDVTDIEKYAIDEGTIIYTKSNTEAHKYAEENKQGYIIDDEAPTVVLTPNGNNNIQKEHNVKIVITDNKEKVGVKNSSLKYQWTQSKEQPSKGSFTESFENNQTLTKNTDDGEWYLWIYAKDNLDNETIARSEAFCFDNTAPVLNIKYSTKGTTKENIIVTITANEEIQEVEGWTISTDKKQLTKEYEENAEETITIKDIAGNETTAQIHAQKIKIGDINADDKIDITDIILLKRHLIAGNRTNWILTGNNLEAADMNENGKVDISDLLLLKREVAQNI